MINDFFTLAVRNLLHRKRRSWLTVIGIFIGIAAVVSLVSLGQGLEDSVEKEFESIGSNKLFINPGGDQTQGNTASGSTLTDEDLQAIKNVKSVDEAGGALFKTAQISYDDNKEFVVVLGIPMGEAKQIVETSWAMEVGEGRELRPTDTSSIVIGSAISDKFNTDIGIRSQLEVRNKTYRVAGILKPTGDPSIDGAVQLPIENARELLEAEEDTYDWIFARIQDGFEAEEAKEEVEEALRQRRNVEEGNERFTVSTQEDLISSFTSILNVVRGVVIGIASISLLVGAVGIMNTMYTAVTQRTREIGVMKAIGATNRQVMLLFILESGVLGLIGGGVGVLVGASLSSLASWGATQAVNIPINPYLGPELLLGSLVFSFIIGTVSGVLPARRAAKLEPAEALRYE
ncbi:MAG: ABC transporter permease [Nanohaloarchaea archaeon]|nr:ABC transporter permease [Candidatus Nanohaloarchaea archaeon]